MATPPPPQALPELPKPISDERADEIANATYTALRATGWNGAMGGLQWDRALIRAALAQPAAEPVQAAVPTLPEPLTYLRFRAAQHLSPDGGVEANEWLEECRAGAVGDDKEPAMPVYSAAQMYAHALDARPVQAVPEGFKLFAVYGLPEMMAALERADAKGYLPDAMRDAWTAFDYRDLAAVAPPPVSQPLTTAAQPEMWAVHVAGPDDLYAMPDRESADALALALNRQFVRHQFDPLPRAEVVAWPHGRESWETQKGLTQFEAVPAQENDE